MQSGCSVARRVSSSLVNAAWKSLLTLLLASCASSEVPPAFGSEPAVAIDTGLPDPSNPIYQALRDIPLQRPEMTSSECPISESVTRDINRYQDIEVFGGEPLYVEGDFPAYDDPDGTGYQYAGMRFIRDTLSSAIFLVRGANIATADPMMFRTATTAPDSELWLLGTNTEEPQPNFERERSWIVDVGVPGSGCYVLQADSAGGHSGSAIVLFDVP